MRRNGFTLIELLVVIAIIAMLAAMIMPAISSVRTAAKKATFASNQRQIGMAYLNYIPDHDGLTIWGGGPGAGATGWQLIWFVALGRDYLDLELAYPPTHAQVLRSIFHDPSDQTRSDYVGWDRAVYNVAINGRSGLTSMAPQGATNRCLSTISHPSELVMLMPGPTGTVAPYSYVTMGATEWGFSVRYQATSWINGGPSLFLRYRGSAPFTFVDGHVESVDSTTFWAELTKDRFANSSIPATNSRMFDKYAINP